MGATIGVILAISFTLGDEFLILMGQAEELHAFASGMPGDGGGSGRQHVDESSSRHTGCFGRASATGSAATTMKIACSGQISVALPGLTVGRTGGSDSDQRSVR
jgi:hypothetical protein